MKKYELTFPQKNIWLVENFYESKLINVISGSLIIKKDFEISRAEKTINKFVELNEAMRLRICVENSIPKQYVVPFVPFEADKINVEGKSEQEIDEIKQEYISTGFDVIEKPLFSYLLIDRGGGVGEIFLKAHHLICDGWSGSKMVVGLAKIYDALLEGKTDFENFPTYLEYIAKENEYKASEKFKDDEKFWVEYLQGFNEAVGIKNAFVDDTKAKRYSVKLDENLNKLILDYCKENKFSPYTIFMTALAIYLERTTEKQDIVIGTPILNRGNFAEKRMQGMFVSTMPVRFKIDESKTFKDICETNAKETMSLFRHQRFPISKTIDNLKKNNGLEESPYKVMVSYQNARATFEKQDTYRMSWNFSGHIQDELEIHIVDLNDDGILEIDYDYVASLFEQKEIEYIAKRLEAIIKDGIVNNSKIQDIEIMSEEERSLIIALNDTKAEYPKNETVIGLFEQQVKLNSDKIAIVCGEEDVTYAKLDNIANTVANYLESQGIKTNDAVGIMQSKSINLIATILGILKVGAIYVPIDINATDLSKNHIINTAGIKLIISDNQDVTINNTVIINIETIKAPTQYKTNLGVAEDVINIMYTSGTTGNPKGVKITNRNIIKLVKNSNYLQLNSSDKMLQTGTFTFDASTLELWNGLLNGITLYLVSDILLNPQQFEEYIKANEITVIFLTTAIFNTMVSFNPKMFENVRIIMTGGEAISKEHAIKLLNACPNVVLKNLYGPTENAVVTTYYDVNIKDTTIPIGKPISNTTCYILDSKLRLLPLNVIGNLFVGGDGVAAGYVNNEELTNQKFIISNLEQGKIYNTGDKALLKEDGNIIFLGRIDNEIKLKGVRVNLDEIKEKVNKYGQVQNNETICLLDNNGNKYLALAFISNVEENISELKTYLRDFLPSYIIPRKIVQLEAIPLTNNGKVDKKKLEKHFNCIEIIKEEVEKYNGIYLQIYNLFKEVLEIEDIKHNDDFFDIGGDSMLGVTLITKAIEQDINITYSDLYKYRTIKELGDMLSSGIDDKVISSDIKDYDYSSIDKLLNENIQSRSFITRECKDIVLSGATGYLGAHIVSEFIEKKNGKIYCLVRNANGEKAEDRFKKRLNYYFGDKYNSLVGTRIIVIEYDGELENFDVIPTNNVTHFINSLALVKHYGDFKEFYRVNVKNVEMISDFCAKNDIELIQISTLSVSGDIVETAQNIDAKTVKKKVYTENDFYNGQELDNVYAYTKFIAERKIYEQMLTNSLQARIFRMGNLFDRFSDGKFQINEKDNAFSTRLKSLISIGIIPEDIKEQFVDFTPIDSAATAIITLLDNFEAQIVYHLYNNNEVQINEIVQAVNRCGMDMRFGNGAEVKQAIYETLKNREESQIDGIVVDITKDTELKYVTDVKVTNDISIKILNRNGFYWPQITQEYMDCVIRRIIKP